MRGSGETTPKIAKYRSADVSAPYILACNYVDANAKIVQYSFFFLASIVLSSSKFSADYALFERPPNVTKLRSYSSDRSPKHTEGLSHTSKTYFILLCKILVHYDLRQTGSGRPEVQLKVLQIVLQLANALAAEPLSSQYLTESNICTMLTLGKLNILAEDDPIELYMIPY